MVLNRKQRKTHYQGVAYVAEGNFCRGPRTLLVVGFLCLYSSLTAAGFEITHRTSAEVYAYSRHARVSNHFHRHKIHWSN